MPTYEYHCDHCDLNFDVVQSFHDEPLEKCPTCGSPVRKVFGNVGIVFKGSGFYKTDSRNGTSSKSKESPDPAGKSDSDSKGSDATKDSSSAGNKEPASKSESPSSDKPKASEAKGKASPAGQIKGS